MRDYDPAVGRYVESDPIGLSGGSWSPYAYANGNPIGRRDPLGLWDWPSLPQRFVNASAGLGDALLLNQGARLRRALGIDGGVNSCSASYHGGQLAGILGGFVIGEGEAEVVEGAFSAIEDVAAAGSRVSNIATDVTAQEFSANLISNGYQVTQETVGPNGPVTVLSNGVTTYNIYTATSTGASSAQVIHAAGQTLSKIRLGGP
jgi:hypothetical protein